LFLDNLDVIIIFIYLFKSAFWFERPQKRTDGNFMDNISIEQIIKVNPPKYVKTLKIGMILLSICSLLLIAIPFGVFLPVGFVIATIFLFRYYNAEYEYSLLEKELTIDRIVSKSSRRRCGIFNIGRLEIMAQYGSDKLKGMEKRNYKTYNYSANIDINKTYVLVVQSNKEMVRIILDPDERMKENIWKLAPSKVNL